MNVEERERMLLKLVEDWREQECRKIIAEAEARAAELRKQAFSRERAALHQRVVAERSRARSLIQAARAERMTRERRRSEHGDALVIGEAWPRLRARLTERWRDPEGRARWVAGALQQALARLPHRGWVIRHPSDWMADEQSRLAADVETETGHMPTLEPDANLVAGLVIGGSGALLDMSVDGLLRDRAHIDARLLALWRGLDQGTPGSAGDGGSS